MKIRMSSKFGFILAILLICLSRIIVGDYEQDCQNVGPLGMITGDIKDEQITASSTFLTRWREDCKPYHARLYLKNRKSWCAKFRSYSEYLEIDLGTEALVSGVMTQGRGDGQEWVTAFMVSYSNERSQFRYVTNMYSNQKIFEGNSDSYTVKTNYFDKPIRARYVRFHTYQWIGHPSMRVELIGCQPCKELLGIFPFGRLSSSGSRGIKRRRSCVEEYGHILSNKGWCSRKQNENQWLQIDIGPPTLITALVSKGRGDSRKNHWVTHYQISYSNNSRYWHYYKEKADNEPKNMAWNFLGYTKNQIRNGTLFQGNKDKNTEQISYLGTPFVARFIRFHPVNWVGRIGMRIGVYGCKFKGECGKGYFKINNHSPCIANLAFKKSAMIARSRGRKNVVENFNEIYQMRKIASRAVDGLIKYQPDKNKQYDAPSIYMNMYSIKALSRETCTELASEYGSKNNPTWYVNLGEKMTINGIIIYTGYDMFGNNQEDRNERIQMENVRTVSVYVDDTKSDRFLGDPNVSSYMTYQKNFCGGFTHTNGALIKPKIHISCHSPLEGQYVYIQLSNSNSPNYKALMCEVMVY